jgi:hypothetical protein
MKSNNKVMMGKINRGKTLQRKIDSISFSAQISEAKDG